MKAIHFPGLVLSGANTKADGSLGIRFSTPTLNSIEKTTIFDLQNQVVDLLIQPSDIEFADIVEVKNEVDAKTPSQRIRSVLFVLWKQNPEGHKEFSTYYQQKMGAIIDHLKEKIND